MSRILRVAAAQLGPISRNESRQQVIERLLWLMRSASEQGARFVVFPEAALTPFFPHWWIDDEEELDRNFEVEMPNDSTQPLFELANELQIGFYLGYTELASEAGQRHRYNSSLLVEADGRIVGKYRKIHLPGHSDYRPEHPFQNLEKRYFNVGNLGFKVWEAFGGRVGMLICNDRRWPEAYRVLGLQGVELIALGYNTPIHNPSFPETDALARFHNLLSMQSGAYQNSTWVVGVAKAGVEEGVSQIGDSCIISPSGEIVAQCTTLGDEVVVADCDLDLCTRYKTKLFNFGVNRKPEYYRPIIERTGAGDPL